MILATSVPAPGLTGPCTVRQPAGSGRPAGALLATLLPLLALGGGTPAQAARLDPLPAVAAALAHVTSYQVTITSKTTGARPRPTGTPRAGNRRRPRGTGLGFGGGPQTRTIVAVRKGKLFEDYVILKGKTVSGKTTTTDLIAYGTEVCTRASGAHTYRCRTASGTFGAFNLDPTAAFAAGAGSTTFARTRARTLGGQACDGYTYKNVSRTETAQGVVYIARRTHLPCEQDATITRRAFSGGGTFTQTSKTVWSRFNDRRLRVPALPKM